MLDDPAFAAVFAPGSRAEVPVAGTLPLASGRPAAIAGQIDRLAVTDAQVLIIDFKTNRPAPSVIPEAYLAQIAVYARLVAEIWPGRTVRAAILWTDAPRLDEVPAGDLAATAARLFGRADTP
ncbi:PD-(D/E)XK nuclease superfamily protein [Methylobrevis pamukkalensis]|uniref:PD-(D/E)XK nuclease superfamily protein n=1 Tax=Methylobrevis pamukkalensis TaxID=1439726 RepID=A0A1E3GZZ4_9HYPH|nr:PD-(D/E)XK nuclease family protein [Methylobrevis pamukkalensis]ODN69495.1 PD-(D/E)XK nuclease superfamily protein [Methylobrevis pamukkalensis]